MRYQVFSGLYSFLRRISVKEHPQALGIGQERPYDPENYRRSLEGICEELGKDGDFYDGMSMLMPLHPSQFKSAVPKTDKITIENCFKMCMLAIVEGDEDAIVSSLSGCLETPEGSKRIRAYSAVMRDPEGAREVSKTYWARNPEEMYKKPEYKWAKKRPVASEKPL
ncbi:MAG: hypothetical protein HYX24_07470 [Candidatus Aenigmarchaeota archaeon]|nr:hypothetical protein [Candidatus Aenigmarchaeota archaeon]